MTDDSQDDRTGSRVLDLGAYIRNQRENAKLSLRNLAKLAGVSNPYLSQIERGLRKPSAEILQAIARALEISSESLYVRAGILDEREVRLDLEDAISRDIHLSSQQKQALVEMYRSFRKLSQFEEEDRATSRKTGLGGIIDALTGDGSSEDEAEDGAEDEDE